MVRPREGPRHTQDQGFTLIEMLVVIIIIGILAATAIPVFLNQRSRGYDASAQSDLRQLSGFEEAMIHDIGRYGTIAEIQVASGGDFHLTPDVTVSVLYYDGVTAYCLSGKHAGSSMTWYWDSQAGGLQDRGTAGCPVTTSGTVGDSLTG